jgi:hypothetical protein
MANDLNDADRDQGGRFRAGAASPNPRGRPRKSNDVDAALMEALSEKVTITEQGKRKRKTKLAIAATQLANQGVRGDLRATKMVLEQARKTEERAQTQAVHAPVMTKTDQEIAALVVARIAKVLEQGGSNASCA